RRRHTRSKRDWSSDVCSSDLRAARLERLRASGVDRAHRQAEAVEQRLDEELDRHRSPAASLVEPREPHFFSADGSTWAMSTTLRSEERRVGKTAGTGWPSEGS